jgi:hypothetical protein
VVSKGKVKGQRKFISVLNELIKQHTMKTCGGVKEYNLSSIDSFV